MARTRSRFSKPSYLSRLQAQSMAEKLMNAQKHPILSKVESALKPFTALTIYVKTTLQSYTE
jgi:hypothetical protein